MGRMLTFMARIMQDSKTKLYQVNGVVLMQSAISCNILSLELSFNFIYFLLYEQKFRNYYFISCLNLYLIGNPDNLYPNNFILIICILTICIGSWWTYCSSFRFSVRKSIIALNRALTEPANYFYFERNKIYLLLYDLIYSPEASFFFYKKSK